MLHYFGFKNAVRSLTHLEDPEGVNLHVEDVDDEDLDLSWILRGPSVF